MLIYVCGKSGSGKSTFARHLASTLNFNYVDVDKIGHSIYEDKTLIDTLSQLFNSNLYNQDNTFDRKKLGKLLFNQTDKNKIETFNNITWSHMKSKLSTYLHQNSVIDYLMLPLTDIWNLKALKVLIKTQNEETRINNILKRDNITKEYLSLRESKSPSFNEDDFDYILTNDYSENFFKLSIKIANEIKNKFNI